MGDRKSILISGIDGFLGFNLLRALFPDYNIIGVSKAGHICKRFDPNEIMNKSIELYTHDNLNELFNSKKIDYIVHTATHHAREFESFTEVFDTNLNLGLELLNYSSKKGVVCFINMDTILRKSTNLYSFTKSLFDESIRFLSKNLSLTIINLKMDMIYGPNAGTHNFIEMMIEKLNSNPKEILLTEGIQKRSFLYVKDIVAAIRIILKRENSVSRIPSGSYFLTNPHLNSIKEVMLTLKEITNSSATLEFGKIPYRENEIMESPADDTLYKILEWFPNYDLRTGLIETIKFNQPLDH